MIVYSANNDSRHRRKIYIFDTLPRFQSWECVKETNILKFELTATRHVDDNTPDTITASIGIPVEADDDAVNEAMN